jgi:hypothetical protein
MMTEISNNSQIIGPVAAEGVAMAQRPLRTRPQADLTALADWEI